MTDGRTFDGEARSASDKPSDLALLKIDAHEPARRWRSATPTPSQVGDVVLAVGNPLGVGQTVTMGIVSAKGRSTGVGDGSYEDFLQTDAPINQGNSGGALVNTKGELVGINSQILSMSDGNIGIGFAIPANMARHVMDDLRTDGRVRRAQLGVTVQPVTSDMAESLGLKRRGGAIVSSVTPGSAAERAGREAGRRHQVVQRPAGAATSTALRNRVAETAAGIERRPSSIVRDGSERTLTVKLDEASAARGGAQRDGERRQADDKTALGVAVAPLTPRTGGARAALPRDAKGLRRAGRRSGRPRGATPASSAGDVIGEVNRQAGRQRRGSAGRGPEHRRQAAAAARSAGRAASCSSPCGPS